MIEYFLLIVCLIGLLVCAAFGGLECFLIMACSYIPAIAVLTVILIDSFKRP